METQDLVQRALGLIKLKPSNRVVRVERLRGYPVTYPWNLVSEPAPSRETLQLTMREDLKAFVRWAAEVYEGLAVEVRKAIFGRLQALQDRVDQAYREGNWVDFQAAFVEARALLAQVQPNKGLEEPAGRHWVYRAWSRVLDAEVWFVCCEQEVSQLAKTGVARGSIYTGAELVELLRLPQPSPKALKDLHQVKAFFNAAVAPVDS